MSAKPVLLALLLVVARAMAGDPAPTLTPGDSLPEFSENDVCTFGFAKAHRPLRTESTALKKRVFER
jgi:hypothetical protein